MSYYLTFDIETAPRTTDDWVREALTRKVSAPDNYGAEAVAKWSPK